MKDSKTEMLEGLNVVQDAYHNGKITVHLYLDQLETTVEEFRKNYIRLDDPVVTGLVEAVGFAADIAELPSDMRRFEKALSAYEARVKEVSRE